MKYIDLIEKIFYLYDIDKNHENELLNTHEYKFCYIKNIICRFHNDNTKYFLMNWNVLENYYIETMHEMSKNNLSCSYSIEDEEEIECSYIEVVNYIYDLYVDEENQEMIDKCEKLFYRNLDKNSKK